MLKKVSCPSCRSSLKPDAYYCDYCGTFFEKKKSELEIEQLKRFEQREEDLKGNTKEPSNKTEEDLFAPDNFVSTEEIERSTLNGLIINNRYKSGMLILIPFIILWCGGAFFGGVSALSSGAPVIFGLFPFGIGIVGALAMGSAVKASFNSNLKDVNALCEQKKYEEAYKLLQTKLSNSKSPFLKSVILSKLIIIGYYKMNDIDQVKEYIILLEAINYDKNPTIAAIAKSLNVNYEPQVAQFDEDDF